MCWGPQMKFAYVDESGSSDHTDVFVMAAIVIDAYRLRKHTEAFDELIEPFLAKHPGLVKEIKTSKIIAGEGGWKELSADERKQFVSSICDVARQCSRIFAYAMSFRRFNEAVLAGHAQPFGKSYWCAAASLIAALIQKKMQAEKNNKGLTVLVFDDNKREMPAISELLHAAAPWYDPVYQQAKRRRGKATWLPVPASQRFDQIVNTAFAIKSHHSSFVQVADVASYVFRRSLELTAENEKWEGEKAYIASLSAKLPRPERLGRTAGGSAIDFYQAAQHEKWIL